jgi:hypothetical protein
MTKKIKERQKFIRYYKSQVGTDVANMHDVALFAKKMGWPVPMPPDPIEILAKQFSEAAREEIREDKQTKQPYRANLSFTRLGKDGGRQQTLWVDVDEAPRPYMVKGLTNYRDQMVGEAVIATNTAEHWNRNNPGQMPLVFPTDFTEDVDERRSYPGEKAS